MTWDFTPYTLLYLLSSIVSLVNAFFNWRWRSFQEGIRTLSIIPLFVAGWLFFGFLEMSVVESSIKLIFLTIEDLFFGVFDILILIFVLDYYQLARWFGRKWRIVLVGLQLGFFILKVTNPIHRLIWTGEVPGPPGSNFVFFSHGIAYTILNNIFVGFVVVAILILAYQALVRRGWERVFALSIMVALLLPLLSYLMYYVTTPLNVYLLYPFTYCFSTMILSWMVLENLQRMVRARTDMLVDNLKVLGLENKKRAELESELVESKSMLANRLAKQSNAMTGVYDLILLNNEETTHENILERSLQKILAILECSFLCYYRLDENFLVQDSFVKYNDLISNLLKKFPSKWLGRGKEVTVINDGSLSKSIWSAFDRNGYRFGMVKWVTIKEQDLGLLVACWKDPKSIAVDDIALFSGIVDGLGLILENARLNAMATDEAKRQERRRLGRDLHDSVTQSLHSLVLFSETARVQAEVDPKNLQLTLGHLETSARQALKEIRLLLYELRLASPMETNLASAILNRLEAVEKRVGILASIEVDENFMISKKIEGQLYPLVMEALNNSLKHSRANQVSVFFGMEGASILVEIRDNGVGFDPELVRKGGMGIQNMEERCRNLHSWLQIDSKPGQGTSIRVLIPGEDEILLDTKKE